MSRDDDPAIIAQAIGWHVRQAEMDDAAWQDFVVWLEASPRHAQAYDRLALEDRALEQPAIPVVPANDDRPVRRWSPFLIGGALAASLALVLALPLMRQPASHLYFVNTQPGERQTVQLADGTRIELSGGSRLQLDRADARIATLETGDAVFTVRHDAARPFTLHSGGIAIRDLGTVFNVTRSGPRLDVQVSQGSVLFQPDRQAIALAAGDALTVHEDSGQIVREHVPVTAVGGWRKGVFSFEGDSLQSIFATLHRTYGAEIVLDGDLAQRPFTGMIRVTGSAERDVPHLAALIGVTWRRDGARWILTPQTPAR